MRRSQASSIDLVISIVGIILFIALVAGVVLRFSSGPAIAYDGPLLDQQPFLNGSRLNASALAQTSSDQILGGRYDHASYVGCAIVTDSVGVIATMDQTDPSSCSTTDFCAGHGPIVEHLSEPVFVDQGTGRASDNRIAELDVVVCRA